MPLAFAAWISIVLPLGCPRSSPWKAGTANEPIPRPAIRIRHPEEAPALTRSLRAAVAWASTLDLNPIHLRRDLRMKGIKHFVESLDLLLLARDWPGDPQLSSLAQTRARQALAVTADPEYHRLDVVDDARFRQDSMSYLRACWLAEQFGWDTADYRRKIQRVLPRIHRHLPTRGIDQRMGFALLLRQLGFPQTETIASIWPETLLARHAPLAWYLESGDRPYDLTHEIFAMSWRGARSVPFPSPADARYARGVVRELLQRCLASGNLDLAGELLVNLAELEDAGGDLARRTRAFLFAGQNPDGSFGVYDQTAVRRAKRNPSYDVRIGGNLHTTMVVLWALITTA